jgi:hypothetical protein
MNSENRRHLHSLILKSEAFKSISQADLLPYIIKRKAIPVTGRGGP